MNMKKIIASGLVFAMALTGFVGMSATAEAKVYNYDITQENFPVADYAERYADVKAAFGDDAAAIYNHYKFYGVEEGRIVKITKEILESQANSDSAIVAYKLFALSILETIVNDNMSDAEKVKAVENWMSTNITFGTTADANCYHIIAPMLAQPTAFEGYAETFEFFMDALGIQAITNADLKSNKVNVDGVWYDVNIPAGILY